MELIYAPYKYEGLQPGRYISFAISPQPTSYSDDFSNPNSGWSVGSSATSSLAYGQNEFVIKLNKASWMTWSNAGQTNLTNIHIEVTAQKLTNTGDAAFGIVCNFVDNKNFDYLGFSRTGYYEIAKFVDSMATLLTSTNNTWVTSDQIQQNSGSYQVGADCGNGTLALYVDGTQIASVTDGTFTKGDVGLFAATSLNVAQAEVHFANFTATALTGQ